MRVKKEGSSQHCFHFLIPFFYLHLHLKRRKREEKKESFTFVHIARSSGSQGIKGERIGEGGRKGDMHVPSIIQGLLIRSSATALPHTQKGAFSNPIRRRLVARFPSPVFC